MRDIIDPSRDLGHVDRTKMPASPPFNPAVPDVSSCSGAVTFQDRGSLLETATTPVVKATKGPPWEDGNKNNNKTRGHEEGESAGPISTEVELEHGVLVTVTGKTQQQQKQQQGQEREKNGNNRVACEDCS